VPLARAVAGTLVREAVRGLDFALPDTDFVLADFAAPVFVATEFVFVGTACVFDDFAVTDLEEVAVPFTATAFPLAATACDLVVADLSVVLCVGEEPAGTAGTTALFGVCPIPSAAETSAAAKIAIPRTCLEAPQLAISEAVNLAVSR